MTPSSIPHKQERLERANQLLAKIAQGERAIFSRKGRPCHLELDDKGKVWFADPGYAKRIYTHYLGVWYKFYWALGLRPLIEGLRDYVIKGQPVSSDVIGPWPAWFKDGDPWGCGGDLPALYEFAVAHGICDGKLPEAIALPAHARYTARIIEQGGAFLKDVEIDASSIDEAGRQASQQADGGYITFIAAGNNVVWSEP